MEHNDKIKKAFWITEDMDREIDAHLVSDNWQQPKRVRDECAQVLCRLLEHEERQCISA